MNMKNRFAFFCMVFMLVLATLPVSAIAADTSLCPERTLSASGNGEIKVIPDIALINVGVMTENRDVQAAQTENAQIMDRLITSLMVAGIAREDIQTSGYSIYPVYDDTSPLGQKIKYYQVTNSVQITIRDLTRAGKIVDLAVANGANQVNSISFMLSEEKEQATRAEALTMAVKNARADADTVALATGTTITGVQSITIGSVYVPIVYDNRYMSSGEVKTTTAPTPIEPGQISITAQVSIAYLIQ
jgi:uncharacterized protein YggE